MYSEMNLEDGRFLMASERYHSLATSMSQVFPLLNHAGYQIICEFFASQSTLDQAHIIPVHPDFRVIALGLPVPRYPGNPLDPPLRSRLQAHWVSSTNTEDIHHRLNLRGISDKCVHDQLTNIAVRNLLY
jgi:hypothetical protein